MSTCDIAMTRNDYRAIDDARDHVLRALSAARAATPFDSEAMVALIRVQAQLTESLRLLEAMKQRARVTA